LKTIHYADYDVTTTDETADAVLAYAQVLALKGKSDTVHVSGFDDEGQAKEFDLLLGPSSQIIASTTDVEFEGPTNDADVAEIITRTEALAKSDHAVAGSTLHDFIDLDDFDTLDFDPR
jgi:hypothetical protein